LIANALSAGFHRIIHRALPAPVGFRDRVTRYRHFIAACSAVEEKTPRWDILGTIIVVAGIVAARNAALHDLTKEIDPASLADLLGYSTQLMNIHAARAAVPMATYPALKQPAR
jgi:hypothetical protein